MIYLVDNMKDIQQNLPGFKKESSKFISLKSGKTKSKIILKGGQDKQIFQMKDGKFVLEVINDEMECEFFYSNNIKKLI